MKKLPEPGDWIFVRLSGHGKATKAMYMGPHGNHLHCKHYSNEWIIPPADWLDHILDFEQLEVTEVNIYHEDVRDPVLPLANEYEFNAARIKIKESNASGYYVEVDGEKYPINPDGTITPWPPALFPMLEEQLDKLTTQ